MYRHLLLILTILFAMLFGSQGKAAASPQQRDRLEAIEQHQPEQQAVLTDNTNVYRICCDRHQRLLPSSNTPNWQSTSKLPYKTKFYQLLLNTFRGQERQESAPLHFDVAGKYYVICLRHLIC